MITQAEKTVLSWLISSSREEILSIRDQIIIDRWSKDARPFIRSLIDYAESRDTGFARDWVMNSVDDVELFADIITSYASENIGKKRLAELIKNQELQFYQAELNRLKRLKPEEVAPAINELAKQRSGSFRPRSLAEVGKDRVEEKKLEAIAPSTGYRDLDHYIVGFIPGHNYVLSGLTNAGKSTMCLNFVYRASMQGKKCLYFSLEPENTIVDYLASIRTGKRFKDLTSEDILVDDPNIHVFGKDNVRQVSDLVAAIRSLPRYDFIVIDHIGYFTSDGSNTTQKESDVMKQLAGLAKERQCAIMSIQHFNKAKSNKENPENNITGSAAFKNDATDVLIVTRDTQENELGIPEVLNTGMIMVRKSKSERPQGIVRISFVTGTAVILDSSDQSSAF